MFLNEPHSTHRYYGELLNAYENRLFLDADDFNPYFCASYFSFYVDMQIRNGVIGRVYKKFKFHIICAMRTLIAGSTVVFGQARKQQKICKKLWQVIQDNSEMDRILHAAITCLDSACRVCDNVPVSDQHRSREITLSMIGYAEKRAKAVECSSFLKVGDIVHCTVTAMNLSFVNVAIKTDDARNYGSIHIAQLAKNTLAILRMK